MSLSRYDDRIYLDYKSNWFVWESSWDSFRPVDSLKWNGSKFVLDDVAYTSDPFDPLYGYGSEKMKHVCGALTQAYEPSLEKARNVRHLSIGPTEWWRDRSVALSGCADRSLPSWKQMCRGKPRTCRSAPKGKKLTRRQRN